MLRRDPISALFRGDPSARANGPSVADNRRKTGRVNEEGLSCSIGELVNISAGGFQAVCCSVPENPVEVTFSDGDRSINATAQVSWSNPKGKKKFLVGFSFVNPEFNLLRKLRDQSMNQHIKRVI